MKKRADGRYCKQIFIGYKPDGTRRMKTIYGKTIREVEKKEADKALPPKMPRPVRMISPREALLSPSEECDVEEAEGRILANPTVSCPPAVPVAVCGECIDEAAIRCFQYYGITRCRVVKE